MSRVHTAFLQRTVRYHSPVVLRSFLSFTSLPILFVRPSAGTRSFDLQVLRRRLAAVADNFILDLLTFVERAEAGALHCRDMDEHVLSTILRLDEAEALRRVEPLYRSGRHSRNLQRLDNERSIRCAFRGNPARDICSSLVDHRRKQSLDERQDRS